MRMKRTLITPDLLEFPDIFRPLLDGAKLYDSSCSNAARVIFIDKDGGYYLKSAASGTLAREAELTRFFHEKALAAEVVEYYSDDKDWLLTTKVSGEDCTYKKYLDDPNRLCDVLAKTLRSLHSLDTKDCPVPNRTADYLREAEKNYRSGKYDASLFPGDWGFTSASEAWSVISAYGGELKTDTLLHGDYCLPNIMLDDWHFSGFIDLDCAGVGDRHVDLFWGAWTLFFNLKTDRYTERFLDAYGKDRIESELLRLVAAVEVFA